MIDACDSCLRRSFLIAHLAPRIAGLLAERRERRVAGLLSLPEDELLAAAAGRRVRRALAYLDSFDADARRDELAGPRSIAVCMHSVAYPQPLLQLDDPPTVLFGVGRVEALETLREEPAVAVVGSRRASPYGTEVAYALGRGLGASGVPVVSGLALGSTRPRTTAASTAAAFLSPSSPADRMSPTPVATAACTRGCATRASSWPSCRRARNRSCGASPPATGSWRASPA